MWVLASFVLVLAILCPTQAVVGNAQHYETRGYRLLDSPSNPNRILRITLAVKLSNTEGLEQHFWRVSDPKSREYGLFLSSQQLADLYGPKQESIDQIENWLRSHEVEYKFSMHREFVTVVAQHSKLESMFGTNLYTFEHKETGKRIVRGFDSQIPAEIEQHVDFVSGLFDFPKQAKKSIGKTQPVGRPNKNTISAEVGSNLHITADDAPVLVQGFAGDGQFYVAAIVVCKNGQYTRDLDNPCNDQDKSQISALSLKLSPHAILDAPPATQHNIIGYGVYSTDGALNNTIYAEISVDYLSQFNYIPLDVEVAVVYSDSSISAYGKSGIPVVMGAFTTADSLASYYKTNYLAGKHGNNKQSVAEFSEQYYSIVDLQQFFSGTGMLDYSDLVTLVGPNDSTNPGDEANLDIQYIMAVGRNVTTWFWSITDESEDAFLTWIVDVTNTTDDVVPKVHSISYGDVEYILSDEMVDRYNSEFQKAALRGLSIIFSSGDDGVANEEGRTNATFCTPFTPSFPATSPYVTAVGATQSSTLYSPFCTATNNGINYSCDAVKEVACASNTGGVITSGGGFSTKYAMPDYQKAVVEKYLNISSARGNLPPQSFFNSAGRGYPDVAVNGHNYLVEISGQAIAVHGTSASAPTFAGMISLLNDIRISNGQPTLGFLNPWLYQMAESHSDAFYDVLMGDNKCTASYFPGKPICCEYGFYSAPGWDPVTGIGSPKFDLLMKYDAELQRQKPLAAPLEPQFWVILVFSIALLLFMAASLVYVCVKDRSRQYESLRNH